MPPKLTPAEQKVVEEFNPLDHNDSVLGRYLLSYERAKTPYGISEEENKKADKKINKWLTTFLLAHRAELQKAREEMRQETMRKVMSKLRNQFNPEVDDLSLEEVELALYELDQPTENRPKGVHTTTYCNGEPCTCPE